MLKEEAGPNSSVEFTASSEWFKEEAQRTGHPLLRTQT